MALNAEEGRGTLRKAGGSCERAPIPGCPNGEIRLSEPQSSTYEYIVCRGEPGELKHLSNRRKREDSLSSGERKGKSPNRYAGMHSGVVGSARSEKSEAEAEGRGKVRQRG